MSDAERFTEPDGFAEQYARLGNAAYDEINRTLQESPYAMTDAGAGVALTVKGWVANWTMGGLDDPQERTVAPTALELVNKFRLELEQRYG